MFISPKLSLCDLIGEEYINVVYKSYKYLHNEENESGFEKIDFYPIDKQNFHDSLLDDVGKMVVEPFQNDLGGFPTDSFKNASNYNSSPVGSEGCVRIGEDGYMYLIGKSEHYHASLGHNFDGYKLIEKARRLGISNAAHNNTRGYITRKLENDFINVLNSNGDNVLNRIINLSTGSLAVEAGVKMMLARFYKHDSNVYEPIYKNKIPVFLVIGSNDGDLLANYHGTTIMTQTFRGMWSGYYQKISDNDIYKIIPVNINDVEDFKEKITKYNTGKYKTAGFIHEIIMMNYGAIKLTYDYLHGVYDLCRKYDTPILVDEIQSCMWYPNMFLFKKYNLNPDMVVIGKGFPGGEYASSKIILTKKMDNLNQFGALVTNGQEELSSIAYLVTMAFSKANETIIDKLGNYYFEKLVDATKNNDYVEKIEGMGHCSGIHFKDIETAKRFVTNFSKYKIDYALHLYKPHCPPAVLFKPPLISSEKVLSYICEKVEQTLTVM